MLLSHFDQLLRTPGDVEQLNRTILELAVRGRLDTRDPDDEPATALLARIRAEKARLEAAGEIRRSKPLPKVKPEEIPFALPDGWVWCRFGEICVVERGISFPASAKETIPFDGGIACLRTANVQTQVDWSDLLYISEDYVKSDAKLLRVNDILISMANSYALVGKVSLVKDVPFSATFGGFIAAIRCYGSVDPQFLYLALASPYIQAVFRESSSQTTNIANISLRTMYPMLFPLPPLAEQQRIVAAVEGLLAATAGLGESLAGAEAQRQALTAAALHRLESASDPSAAAAVWALIREHFAALIHTPESVAGLKQTILQLAVQGRLVPQQPEDEPASSLLARIRAEKQRLEAAGEIRSSKPLPKVKPEEMPFDLPGGWVWVRLDELLTNIQAGKSPTAENRPAESGERGVLKVSAVSWGTFQPNENKALFPDTETGSMATVRTNDFLITRANTAELVGAVVLVDEDYPRLHLSDKTLRLDFVDDSVHKPFMLPALRAAWVRTVFSSGAIGTSSSMRNISQAKIRSAPIALPPLAEQQRIVERVEALFALCDGLAGELAQAEAVRGRWVAAVLAGAG